MPPSFNGKSHRAATKSPTKPRSFSWRGLKPLSATARQPLSGPWWRRWQRRTTDAISGDSAADSAFFRRQEVTFAILNFTLVAALLVIHAFLTPLVGEFAVSVLVVLVAAMVVLAGAMLWLYTLSTPISPSLRTAITWCSIAFSAGLTLVLMSLTRGEDSQSFILMVVPVVEAAFRLGFIDTLGVIVLANSLNFFEASGLGSPNEYFEAGATSIIYTMVGVLVWLLVNSLRGREESLRTNIAELERTRERLLTEEKLAAIGRLSGAIAHEIRNPVAIISSSLATANRPDQDDSVRAEMFAIAATEAERLERLTADFLFYARPRATRIARSDVLDTLNYIAAVARPRASDRGIVIRVAVEPGLQANFDPFQVHQALLNLVLNAIEACVEGDVVTLCARSASDGRLTIEVSDPRGPLPAEVIAHLFEPFFTTKPRGTGLGLAIARNIARSHRGDLLLSVNRQSRVAFTLDIPADASCSGGEALSNDANTRS